MKNTEGVAIEEAPLPQPLIRRFLTFIEVDNPRRLINVDTLSSIEFQSGRIVVHSNEEWCDGNKQVHKQCSTGKIVELSRQPARCNRL